MLAGNPRNGQERGEHVVNCMKALVPILHERLVDLWDAVVPKLLSYLSGMYDRHCDIVIVMQWSCTRFSFSEQSEKGTWDQKHWEDLMLKVIKIK